MSEMIGRAVTNAGTVTAFEKMWKGGARFFLSAIKRWGLGKFSRCFLSESLSPYHCSQIRRAFLQLDALHSQHKASSWVLKAPHTVRSHCKYSCERKSVQSWTTGMQPHLKPKHINKCYNTKSTGRHSETVSKASAEFVTPLQDAYSSLKSPNNTSFHFLTHREL